MILFYVLPSVTLGTYVTSVHTVLYHTHVTFGTQMSDEPKCALNLRGFPADLKWKLREKAAQQKMSLLQFVEKVLRAAVQDEQAEAAKKKQP